MDVGLDCPALRSQLHWDRQVDHASGIGYPALRQSSNNSAIVPIGVSGKAPLTITSKHWILGKSVNSTTLKHDEKRGRGGVGVPTSLDGFNTAIEASLALGVCKARYSDLLAREAVLVEASWSDAFTLPQLTFQRKSQLRENRFCSSSGTFRRFLRAEIAEHERYMAPECYLTP